MDSNAMFSVFAVKGGPPYTTNGLSYQWQSNAVQLSGNLYWTNMPGETNSTLAITHANTNNVGYYRVLVSGSPTATSDPASLQVMDVSRLSTGVITVFGTPIVKSGSGNCPGASVGRIYYTNTPPAWGFAVINRATACTATDATGNTTTKIQYAGLLGDPGCGVNGTVTVPTRTPPIPAQVFSPRYQFILYFPTQPVPTGAYGISLTNLQ